MDIYYTNITLPVNILLFGKTTRSMVEFMEVVNKNKKICEIYSILYLRIGGK
jgi:hypothetical protein